MLIKFNDIIGKYGRPSGVIHIGAHLMEERNDYTSNGLYNTIWVEANPKIYSQIKLKQLYKDEHIFNYAISDIDNNIINLNVTNNGQSSSILELERHKIHHPNIFVTEILEVNTKRMDTLLVENNISISNYNFINIDIQGAELLALKGFGDLLTNFEYIYTEINTSKIYKDCAIVDEIDNYLEKFKFKRVETYMTEFEWGDALYIKY